MVKEGKRNSMKKRRNIGYRWSHMNFQNSQAIVKKQ